MADVIDVDEGQETSEPSHDAIHCTCVLVNETDKDIKVTVLKHSWNGSPPDPLLENTKLKPGEEARCKPIAHPSRPLADQWYLETVMDGVTYSNDPLECNLTKYDDRQTVRVRVDQSNLYIEKPVSGTCPTPMVPRS